MTTHAKFSPSAAHRWIPCPASITMEAGYPDETSEFAQEGTQAHELGRLALETGRDCASFVGQGVILEGETEPRTFTSEMAAYVQEYVDLVRAIPGERYIESRVDFSDFVPDGFGTADAVIYNSDDKVLTVVDLKYGTGVRVEATDNPQAQLYALGALNDYGWLGEIQTVVCLISQPRLDHVSEWTTDPNWLTAFGLTAGNAAQDALSSRPTFNPGESQCRFCRAKGDCKALAAHNLAVAVEEFDQVTEDMALRELKTLTGEEIAAILPHLKLIQEWVKAVEARAITEIDAGRPVPGYKLVEGRSFRQWTDEREAEQCLLGLLDESDVFTRKLISPAQAEKILGKMHPVMFEQVTKPAGKPTLVPESDGRPPLPASAARDFSSTTQE